MCTVSYIPSHSGYILTSNRDEKSTRSNAIAPKQYTYKNTQIIFPKDPDANGTWIVFKENNDALCLLNGAFENFIDKENYKKSRGIIVLEIASATNMVDAFQYIDLSLVAPFTLILVQNKILYECRWDGTLKYFKELNNELPHIWSSATLYDVNQRIKRENWFNNFIEKNNNIEHNDIIDFHKNTGDGNVENDLVMNRDNKYFTVSITSILVAEHDNQMLYQNLGTNFKYVSRFTNEFA